jgi:hypothetical protein
MDLVVVVKSVGINSRPIAIEYNIASGHLFSAKLKHAASIMTSSITMSK